MRKRNHVVPVRLNAKEFRHLDGQVAKSGLNREEFLRSLILGAQLQTKPCEHHAELLRKIAGLCNNANSEISTQLVQIKADMERKEQYLKMETQKKNDLITYLAHDLKTPLTSVMGYLNLLEDAPDMPLAQREKYTHIARKKAERLDSLIQEFFEITRYNLQNITLEKENIDLYYMLIQMKEEFYPVLAQKGNSIELKVPEDLQVYGDADKLARVFNNIIRNAVSYSYPSSVITIEGEKNSDGVCLFFRNKGKTIPKEKLSRVFQKFFRIDEARSSDSAGAGLGLAIAKEIVELHGGSISAISEQEETVFQIVLPEN